MNVSGSFQPADLGACGEPYAFDVICQLTLGLALHGLLGVGIAGVNRPDSAWKDLDGIEFGGRIEFRWDRFSFAITDFYGYHDTPSIRPIGFYERNVDPDTGRARAWGETGRCENAAGFLQTVDGDNIAWNATNFRLWQLGGGDVSAGQSGSGTSGVSLDAAPPNPFWADDYSRNSFAMTLNGVGIDPACLKPGGAAGQAAQNGLDVLLVGDADTSGAYNVPGGNISGIFVDDLPTASFITSLLGTDPDRLDGPWNIEAGQPVDTDGDGLPDQIGASPQNALQYNPGNLQLFTALCSATVGIAASLDPGACAWNIFGTGKFLSPGTVDVALSEVLTTIFAGETDSTVMGFMRTIQSATHGTGNAVLRSPITPLNLDGFDGRSTAISISVNPVHRRFRTTRPEASGGVRRSGC